MKKLLSLFLAVVLLFAIASCSNRFNNVIALNPIQIPDTPAPSVTPSNRPTNEVTKAPDPTPTVPPHKESDISLNKALEFIPSEYQDFAYFNPALAVRYVEYKERNPNDDYEKIILLVNIGLDKPFYSDIKIIDAPHSTDVLVNKYNKLPDDFAPNLVEIPPELCTPGMGRQYLREDAKEAFEKMHYDAKELDLNITAFGTYRSIQLQHDIWNRKVKSGRTIEDVDSLNSRGGHSEHHTGLTVDVIWNNYSVEESEEFLWYKENAHNYGFIIRYPKGKEHITGYSYEPWHLRYVGVELATQVYNSGLTYEEYYAINIEPK